MDHRTTAELEAGLAHIRAAPKDVGVVLLIARRPAVDMREELEEARLDVEAGLVGDGWSSRPSSRSRDGSPHPDMQLNVMSARVIGLLASQDRWALAGDQFYVDLDLSTQNLPPGTRLAAGTAIIEVTAEPHTGCSKFGARFGADALHFVNTPLGKQLRLRGLNARVVTSGTVRRGDRIAPALPAAFERAP